MTAPVSAAPSGSQSLVQRVDEIVARLLGQHFSSTLGSEQNIVMYVRALMQKESSLNPNGPPGSLVSDLSNARGRDYMNSSAVKSALLDASPLQYRNVQDGKRAHGIMQIMGWNIVRGGSSKTQKCEFQELRRQDLAGALLVNAGDDIRAKLSGEANMENSILAGLLLLESKWQRCRSVDGGWSAGGETFTSRLACAIGAYQGAVPSTSPQAPMVREYVSSIMGGDAYQAATKKGAGQTSVVKTAQSTAAGPATNGGGNKGEVVGC